MSIALPPSPPEAVQGFALSPQQSRQWRLREEEPSWPFTVSCSVLVEGEVDPQRLRESLLRLVERYEILRTSFPRPRGMKMPLQAIDEAALDWRQEEPEDPGPEVGAGAPPLAARLRKLSPTRHELRLELPAVCADARSLELLVEELAATYGGSPELEEALQYADLSAWQNDLLEGEEGEEGRRFWKTLAPLELDAHGIGGRRASAEPGGGELGGVERCSTFLSPALTARLDEAREALGAADSELLLAAWTALLGRLGGQPSLTVGTAFTGRTYEGLETAVGPLTRYLPVTASWRPERPFGSLVADLRESLETLAAWQEYFHWDLLAEGAAAEPRYTAGFDFLDAGDHPGFSLRRLSTPGEPMAVRLSGLRRGDELRLELTYDRAQLEAAAAERLLARLVVLLEGAVAAPSSPVGRLPILPAEERRHLVEELNATEAPFDEVPVHHLFERAAARRPDAPGLVYEGESWSLGEVNARANRLARYLRALGVEPETPVALYLERSAEAVVAMLAVLKAGGCYLPLDPSSPRDRILKVLEGSAVPVVLGHGESLEELAEADTRTVPLDTEAALIACHGAHDLEPAVSGSEAAYILFTSGSTGRPKGVVVEHRQLSCYVQGVLRRLELGEGASFAVVSTFAADLGHTAIYGSLASGGCLHVISEERGADGESLARYFERHEIDCLKIVPGHLAALQACPEPERLMPRKRLVVGGEASYEPWIEGVQALAPHCRILNHYGPTETTVGVLTHPVGEGRASTAPAGTARPVPLGRPLPNVRAYCLDPGLELTPVGTPGELGIGGATVARGYHRLPAATAERFVPDPWSPDPGARLYRTGDRARLGRDGVVDFLGRVDDQVKIRGFRVEPGEVAAAAREHPAVEDVAVVARESAGGDKELVAYVVFAGETGAGDLEAFLGARLPPYLLPAAIVPLERLPRTANGKLDRERLPAPVAAAKAEYVPPRTPLEATLTQVWAEVLGVPRLGIRDNFFHFGGDSIRSITARGKALEQGIDLPVALIFDHPTVEELAANLDPRAAGDSASETDAGPFSLLTERDRAGLPPDLEDAYPLTRLQEGMLYHSELEEGAGTYHDIGTYHLRVAFDPEAMQRALAEVARRHPVLRTSFDLSSFSEGLQLVHSEVELPLDVTDLRRLSPGRQEQALARWLKEEACNGFDWRRPPLLRFHVHRVADDRCHVSISFHHAILDGWSRHSLVSELMRLYLEEMGMDGSPPPPVEELTYRRFVALEREALASREQLDFWSETLKDPPSTRLPRWPGKVLAPTERLRHRLERVPVAPHLSDALKRLAETEGVPLKTVLLTAHLKVLEFLTGSSDVITGVVTNGRPEEKDGERLMGLFLNTLPLRLALGDGSWRDLLHRVSRRERSLLPYRRFPLAELQRTLGTGELFDVVFNYMHFHVYKGLLDLEDVEYLDNQGFEEGNFALVADFSLDLVHSQVRLVFEYDAALYPAAQIRALGSYYLAALKALASKPAAGHRGHSLLSPTEVHQILTEWNDTARPFPEELGLHQLFEEQARRDPEAVAVLAETTALTYGELDRRARLLAAHLLAARPLADGSEPASGEEWTIALCTERSAALVVAMLGVLKAGAAFVPLDPAYPAARLAYMVEDSGAALLITEEGMEGEFSSPAGGTVVLDRHGEIVGGTGSSGEGETPVPPPVEAGARSLAYVIYTSGSTGQAKGVMVPHRAAVNYTLEMCRRFRLTAEDRILQFASPAFDVVVEEIFPALAAGAAVVLPERDLLMATADLQRVMESFGVTGLELPAAFWHEWVDDLERTQRPLPPSLRFLLVGCEKPDPRRVEAWLRLQGVPLVCVFGLTETTITNTLFTFSPEVVPRPPDEAALHLPIGRAVANNRIFVLDEHWQAVPFGRPGQLFVGGEAVGRGYWRRPGLTAERFVPDPFAERPGARLYRTGDLVRTRPDGNLDFLGRLDHQVKIRGFRVELGEVESALREVPEVRRAAVSTHQQGDGVRRLVAYVVWQDEAAEDPSRVEALRRKLERLLPGHLLPSAYVDLEQLPLTAAGKVDLTALPAPGEAIQEGADTRRPVSLMEEMLLELWQEVLGLGKAGRYSHFFEAGGDSLLAIRLISRVRDAFQIEVPLAGLFEHPTVEGLAALMEGIRRQEGARPAVGAIPRREHEGRAPLSFAQERLWFLHQLMPGSSAYHMPGALLFEGELHLGVLERAISEVVRRHEVLRTTFEDRGGVAEQVIRPVGEGASGPLPVIDLSALSPEGRERESRRWVRELNSRPFDLTRGPLLRQAVIRKTPTSQILAFPIHHIVGDGWSMEVLVQEVTTLYRAFLAGQASPLPELPIQYGDYAAWQRGWLRGDVLQAQLDFWRRSLKGAPAVLELPTDRPRSSEQSHAGGRRLIELDGPLTADLKALSRRLGGTLFMTLMAAIQTLLARHSDQRDIVLGTPVAGRNRSETEGLVGLFVNTLALRTDLSGEPSFEELFRRVRSVALEANAHQELPFEKLVEELQPDRNLAQNPLFQVSFVLQNIPAAGWRMPDLEVQPLTVDQPSTRFDLEWMLWEEPERIRGLLIYSRDLFDATTCGRWVSQLSALLTSVVADPRRRITELSLLPDPQRHQIVAEWNDTRTPRSPRLLLHRLVEEQVERTPDGTALSFEDRELGYREMDRRATALACHLRTLGVGPEVTVGVFLERSLELPVALLAVLKAGGAYLPLDPENPPERLRFVVADADVAVLLVTAQTRPAVTELGELESTVVLDVVEDVPTEPGDEALGSLKRSLELHLDSQAAYTIYTSGSTGKPKGAVNSHRGICNRLLWMQEAYDLGPDDRVLQKTPASFDVSVWEFFWPLLTGATMVLARPGGHKDPVYLAELIQREAVTTVHFVPSMLQAFVDEPRAAACGSLRRVIASGEALPRELERRFLSLLPGELHNLYGPTEAAVDVTATACRRERRRGAVPIGRPIANVEIRVVDESLRPVPVGVTGELLIGGVAPARGYLRRPALTAASFVPDPFAVGGRLYRTGDLVRLRPEGEIEFLGRVDHQIKIRGLRIELGEIEAVLQGHPGVAEAVVVDRRREDGDPYLAAYFVPDLQGPEGAGGEAAAERVAQWQAVYGEIYGEDAEEDRASDEEPADPTFDIAGWISSYTGEAIPAGEMRGWVESTVDRLLALAPRRVLEIGCGTGLLLFRVAHHCESYLGTDFSAQVLEQLEERRRALPEGLPQVELMQRSADDFEGIEADSLDLVILNSVAQYFPGIDYFLRVLEGAVRVVRPGGSIFLGDLRYLPLLEAFHHAVEIRRAPASLPLEDLRRRVARRRLEEEELVLDPGLFSALATRLPLRGIRLELKRGRHHNELLQFRYDVVLEVGEAGEAPLPSATAQTVEWSRVEASLAGLRRRLLRQPGEPLVVRGIPNRRVQGEIEALRRASAERGGTAGVLQEALDGTFPEAVEPEDLWKLGAEVGSAVEVGWSADGSGAVDAVFRPAGHEGAPPPLPILSLAVPTAEAGKAVDLRRFANDPLAGRTLNLLVPELQTALGEVLPDYMVPASFTPLKALPLTEHGKVDRRRLPDPSPFGLPGTGRGADEPLEGPRSPVEELLAGQWAEVLRVEGVGRRDSFFDLGGHSLLATQLLSRVRSAFSVEMPLRALFQHPTLAAFAAEVEEARRRGQGAAAPPLRRLEHRGLPPLSFSQARLWFLDQMEPGSAAYNLHSAIGLHGPLKLEVLARSFDEVVRRHEALRTTFTAVDGVPHQKVHEAGPVPLPLIDLSGLAEGDRTSRVKALSNAQAGSGFDLSRGPLLRLRALRLAPRHHVMLISLHHIVGDGWSMALLVREIGALYNAFAAGEPSPLPELEIQYPDFAAWQRRWMAGEVLERELELWRRRLAGAPPLLELPTDRPRPAVKRFEGARRTLTVPAALHRDLLSFGRRQGSTLFMTLLAVFQVLLSRLSGQEDILVGSPVAGRNRGETENLIGFFVNTQVLRGDLSGNPSFLAHLEQVREVALEAHAHQDLPFEKLVEELQPQRSLSHSPLFQVLLVLQNAMPSTAVDSDLYLEPLTTEEVSARFDLTLDVLEGPAGLEARVDYDVDLFDATTIARLLRGFESLLRGALEEPQRWLAELPLLGPEERHQLLVEWGRNRPPYDHRETLHGVFETQAAATPDAVALTFEDRHLTYAELDRQATALARRLRRLGVGAEVRVGLCVERSPEMVLGLLGILKAGGAYLPLDPEYPEERLAFLVRDAEVKVVVTQRRLAAGLPDHGAPVLLVDGDGAEDPPPAATPAPRATAENLAYVIYTSGSTGLPKGSLVAHGGVVNMLRWRQLCFPLGSGDHVLQTDSFSFDASGWQFYWPLLAGARLVLTRPEGHRDSRYLVDLMAAEGITVVGFVPSMLQVLLDEPGLAGCRSLRHLFCGGEALRLELVKKFFDRLPATELHNVYGPTEASIDATDFTLRHPRDAAGLPIAPIGRGIGNKDVYVLGKRGEPLPVGVPGELCVGGVGLARGYLRRPGLTAGSFVPHPFSEAPGKRLYRTGDLVRTRPGGAIEFLGRLDHQVKVRGFRIELGEIEAALGEHPTLEEAVVVVHEDPPGVKRLVAYLAVGSATPPAAQELRDFLEESLPRYMVPSLFIFLEALPLNPNGKVDRKALPEPALERPDGDAYAAPRNEAESHLARVWSEILGVESVGIRDNFFELGGDSILSIQIVARARRSGLQLSPRDLFQHQTIEELAAVATRAEAPAHEQGPVVGPVPLTPIQRWFLELREDDPHHFNQALLLASEETLHPHLLAAALEELMEHHDALRMRFIRTEEGWRQECDPPGGAVPFAVLDLAALEAAARSQTLEAVARACQGSLDIEHGPRSRMVLVSFGDGEPQRLLWVSHHLMVDGVSWRILLEDLEMTYRALTRGEETSPLAPKTTSFKAWGDLLQETAKAGSLRSEMPHWRSVAAAGDGSIPEDMEGKGGNTAASSRAVRISFLPEETRALLQEVPKAYRVQINDILLTALAMVWAEWTGKSLLVDLEGHGREEIFDGVDLSRTVGWLTSQYPVRLEIGEAGDPVAALKAVKEQLRQVPNRGLGYGVLRYLDEDPDVAAALAEAPAAAVSFNYLGQLDQALTGSSPFTAAPESSGPPTSLDAPRPHLLEIVASVAGGRLNVTWAFSHNHHRRKTVENLAAGYLEALRGLLERVEAGAGPGATPSDFPLARLDQSKLDRLADLIGRADRKSLGD